MDEVKKLNSAEKLKELKSIAYDKGRQFELLRQEILSLNQQIFRMENENDKEIL